ncbi:MAG: hypothetical protein L0H93_12020, partial [Nocardioides sp.]|nr:hypothetical protein [Nocardioides sp.]
SPSSFQNDEDSNQPSAIHVMKKIGLVALAITTFGATMALAPAAYAGTNIGWVWNSDDHDAKARFRNVGDHVDLCRHNNAKVKVQVRTGRSGTRSGSYNGAIDTCKNLNWNFDEGDWVQIKVCEVKTAFPDDCSPWSNRGFA